MRRVSVFSILVLFSVVVLSSSVLLDDEASTAAEDGTYSYTYGDYKVRQTSAKVEGQSVSAGYQLEVGSAITSNYTVTYYTFTNKTGILGLVLTGTDPGVTFAEGTNKEILVIPPKVVVNGEGGKSNEYRLGYLFGNTSSGNTYLPGIKTLVISSEVGLDIDGTGGHCIAMKDLESLVVDSKLIHKDQFIYKCQKLSNIVIKELGSSPSQSHFCNINKVTNGQDKIGLSVGTTSDSTLNRVNAVVPVHLTLLPGSVKAKSMDLMNVQKIMLDRGYWKEDTKVSDLANTITNNSVDLKIEYYGTAPKYNVGIASDVTGVVVNPNSASEGESVTITLTPDQGKQVGSVTVVGADGAVIQAIADAQSPNVYTFEMPASDVTVSASFVDVASASVSITPVQSNIVKGQSIAVTVSAVGLKKVKSIFIELNYDSSVFELGSSQYSDKLSTGKVLGKGNERYVVAFASEVDIDGELLTFQLGSKAQAAAGTYKINCTVEINGDVKKGPGATYTAESNITVGALIGDLNSDGVVDESDAVYLLFHTFRPTEYGIPEGQEQLMNFFEKDGSVNSDDAIWLNENLSNLEESLSSGGA